MILTFLMQNSNYNITKLTLMYLRYSRSLHTKKKSERGTPI